jgi:cation diffusion facilitator family transporter
MEGSMSAAVQPNTAGNKGKAQAAVDAGHRRRAMNLSLAVGFAMLGGKWYAYLLTGSMAILSDAAESIVHVIAVAFAVFSLWLSHQPADRSHPYGHEKISFFSAGIEGALILLAAVVIIYEAMAKLIQGIQLENLGVGAVVVAGAGAINGVLGWYLIREGKRLGSLILVANGKHVLTDSWTSLGVIVGLLLTMATGWLPFDPLLAIFVAVNILWSGSRLIRQSIGGLMDEADPTTENAIRAVLDRETRPRGIQYHELRFRNSGSSLWVEFHLLFPPSTPLAEAHWKATEIEAAVQSSQPTPVYVVTHLEPEEGHDEPHRMKETDE